MVPDSDGYQTVDVQIEGDSIVAIAPHLPPLGTLVDGSQKLLLPGFINAHTHSSEMWQRGLIAPLPLELWLAELYDACAGITPEHIYLSALGTAVETLLSGGTTVVDHLAIPPGQEVESVAAAVRAYREVGMRAFVGPLIQDSDLPASVPSGGIPRTIAPYHRTTESIVALMEQLVEQFHRPEEGIHIMVAPTGLQLCSDALIENCVELSDRHQLCRHTHLLETKAQQMLAQEKYGYSAVEHLKHLGFLGPRTSLAHCVWLTDDDIALMAATQSTAVHNPLSNLRLGSGIAPVLKLRQAGANVSFGCDGSASNDAQDMLEVIKIGSTLHTITEFDYRHWISPREAIQMASLGGAIGLGLADQLGTLEVGKKADLVLYDLTRLSLLPRTDPIGLLVLGRPTQAVERVWVQGKPVVEDGQVTTVDMAQLRQELWQQSQWETGPSAYRASMESHYRQVMGLKAG
nr:MULTISPECIES: amidohydrolase [unclassified Leptolyngbya]